MSSTPARGQFQATVVANVAICREHFRLILRLDAFPATEPGQFVQLSCRDLGSDFNPVHMVDWEPGRSGGAEGAELLSPLAMLRRPFSLAGRRDLNGGGVELEIIHRVVGVGTDWLSHVQLGDALYLLGPLGNRFDLPKQDELAVLVGGGVGIPPMIYLAARLAGRRAVAFAGALTRDLLPLTILDGNSTPAEPVPVIEEFARHGIPTVITTDDGSYGFRGFVTQALEEFLAPTGSPRSRVILYTCGPEPMMKRVADIALRRGIDCQIAVERAMACGMGTCQSCCIRVKKPDRNQPPLVGNDWAYRLACTDGPVFRAAELLW
jgi:dihydroorotate dehydrogenase electron transfer subunit